MSSLNDRCHIVGIRPYDGRNYMKSGGCYHTNPHTGEPGKPPSNLSGGLINCMYAVGTTGITQPFEIAIHIWNRWTEIHGDPALWAKFKREKPADWTGFEQVRETNTFNALLDSGSLLHFGRDGGKWCFPTFYGIVKC